MDAESFKDKFLPYHCRLFCTACKLLGNAEDAEDVVQEAYLKLWNRREGLTIVANPEAFCVTLVRNMCLDLLRSGKYVLNRQSVELDEARDAFAPDRLEVRDQAWHVRRIISGLSAQQRLVVTLHDVKGCSYDEIERLTGLKATNVRVLLSRARKKIREEFNKMD